MAQEPCTCDCIGKMEQQVRVAFKWSHQLCRHARRVVSRQLSDSVCGVGLNVSRHTRFSTMQHTVAVLNRDRDRGRDRGRGVCLRLKYN